MTKVIAITGCMGSGKTTLMEQLHQLIPRSQVLREDDYQIMTQMDPVQLRGWIADGCSVEDLNLNGFDMAIRKSILPGESESRRSCPEVLIIESQFGRAHRALSNLIDYQIWIESPLDLCVARKVLEFSRPEQVGSIAEMGVGQIVSFCQNYLELTAQLLRKQKSLVESVSDHTLVNDRSVSYLVDQALGVLYHQTDCLSGLDHD